MTRQIKRKIIVQTEKFCRISSAIMQYMEEEIMEIRFEERKQLKGIIANTKEKITVMP